MYSAENYHEVHYEELQSEGRYGASARLARRLVGSRRTLLDFGCGNGSFLVAAAKEGFEVTGVEYEPSAIENAARKSGLPVMSLEEVRARALRPEVIHVGDVLEHLPDPVGVMRVLEGLLAPNGVLFLEGPLQSNPSLVYYVSRAVKVAKRRLGLDRAATLAPTHLILVNARAQRDFFTRTLGLRCTYFRVTESGWPYLLETGTPRTPAGLVRAAIGLSARVLARALPGWGNRFAAVVAR